MQNKKLQEMQAKAAIAAEPVNGKVPSTILLDDAAPNQAGSTTVTKGVEPKKVFEDKPKKAVKASKSTR